MIPWRHSSFSGRLTFHLYWLANRSLDGNVLCDCWTHARVKITSFCLLLLYLLILLRFWSYCVTALKCALRRTCLHSWHLITGAIFKRYWAAASIISVIPVGFCWWGSMSDHALVQVRNKQAGKIGQTVLLYERYSGRYYDVLTNPGQLLSPIVVPFTDQPMQGDQSTEWICNQGVFT